jgi:hypothetical protein
MASQGTYIYVHIYIYVYMYPYNIQLFICICKRILVYMTYLCVNEYMAIRIKE